MKNIEDCRKELDSFIEKHFYNLSDEEVVKKSLELEYMVFGYDTKNVYKTV